jgi:hypothetical protein
MPSLTLTATQSKDLFGGLMQCHGSGASAVTSSAEKSSNTCHSAPSAHENILGGRYAAPVVGDVADGDCGIVASGW